MKKLLILLCMFLLSCGAFMSSTFAEESVSYPRGKNYLNLQNFRYHNDRTDLGDTFEHIRVKSFVWYTLVLDYEFIGQHAGYPEYIKVLIEEGFGDDFYYEYMTDDPYNGRVYVEFMPVLDWIRLHEIPVDNTRNYDAILYEGLYTDFFGYEPYICETEILEYGGTLPIDYDHQLTTEQIKSFIIAKDPYGGSLEYVVETDDYSSSLKTPGSYEMVFVSTFNRISKKYFLDIRVFDLTSPIITLSGDIQVQLSEKLTIDEIKQLISVTDNVDEISPSDLVVIQDTYSSATTVGHYSITVEATDLSGNTSSLVVPIQLVDLVGPTISGPFSIFLYTTDPALTNQQILNRFNVYDDVDGSNVSFDIITNNYNQQTSPGIYQMALRAGDTQYNFTYKNIEIHVIENRGPIFIEDETIIQASSAENMTDQDIIDWFKNLTMSSGLTVSQVSVLYNEYEGNEKLGGSYYVYLNYELDGQIQTSRIRIDVKEEKIEPNYLLLGTIGGSVSLGFLTFFIIKKKKI
jgi:hypothetical protein